jgi:hypothetical protein
VRRQRILEEWNGYVDSVYHGLASGEQRKQLKMAFFGGALAMQKLLLRDLAPGDEPTEADQQLVRDVIAELMQFGRDVVAGKEEPGR